MIVSKNPHTGRNKTDQEITVAGQNAKKRLRKIEENMYGHRYPEEIRFYERLGLPAPPTR